MFEKSIIQSILNAWAEDQAHPHRGRQQKPLPDSQDIQTILEVAFLASIKREEERPITFGITLLDKDFVEKVDKISGQRRNTFTFNKSLPFTPESVKKIAPAFNPATSSLIVSPIDGSRSKYEILGIMFFSPPTNLFEQIPVGTVFDLFRTDALCVMAVSPGSLIISRGNSVIGRFLFGEFQKAIPTPFVSKAMGKHIINLIKNHDEFNQFQNVYWPYYRDTLFYLLTECSKCGHGGTIILLPKNKVLEYEKNIIPKYVFGENIGLEELLLKVVEEHLEYEKVFDKTMQPQQIVGFNKGIDLWNKELTKLSMNRRYTERIDLLAQLSCIDGALIMNDQLNLLSFGSTLEAPRWNGEVFIGPDGFGGGGENVDTPKLGNRHNSAINFVGLCEDSIAFVISQDGPIRGMVRKDEKTILYWPDCLVSMFLEETMKSKQ